MNKKENEDQLKWNTFIVSIVPPPPDKKENED